jgi:predicted dehydrogenase
MTFEIRGTKGQIEFDSRASMPVRKHINVAGREQLFYESPLANSEEPYTAELQRFTDCIINGLEPEVSAEDAMKALEISIAAIKSSRTGEAVSLGGGR